MEKENKPEATGQKENSPSVVDNPDGTKTVHLNHPIEVAKGVEQSEITFHKPKLGDLRALDSAGFKFGKQGLEIASLGSTIVKAVEQLGNMHPDAAALIDMEDMPVIVETVAGFFGMSRVIGDLMSGD